MSYWDRNKNAQKEFPIGGIEPPAAVWETAMLTTTPYRSGLENHAFRFSFDPYGLASCVSCTSVRASISRLHGPLTQPTSKSWQPSIGYLLVVGFSLCCNYVPWTKHFLQILLLHASAPSITFWLNKLSHVNLWFEARHTDSTVSWKQPCIRPPPPKKRSSLSPGNHQGWGSTELEGFSRLTKVDGAQWFDIDLMDVRKTKGNFYLWQVYIYILRSTKQIHRKPWILAKVWMTCSSLRITLPSHLPLLSSSFSSSFLFSSSSPSPADIAYEYHLSCCLSFVFPVALFIHKFLHVATITSSSCILHVRKYSMRGLFSVT